MHYTSLIGAALWLALARCSTDKVTPFRTEHKPAQGNQVEASDVVLATS